MLSVFLINLALAFNELQLQFKEVNKIGLLLNELNIKYEIYQEDYEVSLKWLEEKRGHVVYIIGKQSILDEINGIKVQSIVAPVFKIMQESLNNEQLNKIMTINGSRTTDAFEASKDNQFLVFRATVPENFNASTLLTLINYDALSASTDLMEKITNGNVKF